MPITRTYQCGDCFHRMTVVLSLDQWDAQPPACPACEQRAMDQQFVPIAVKGTQARHREAARNLAETIASEDYGVADMTTRGKGEPIKHRLKDQGTPAQQAQVAHWTGDMSNIGHAIAAGRKTRSEGGDGLDILQRALKSGAQPDLIEVSKRRMAETQRR